MTFKRWGCYAVRMFYRLQGKQIVSCKDAKECAEWMQDTDRTVARDTFGDFTVSTVFVSVDHNFTELGPPLLFETMVFEHEQGTAEVDRYTTWEEAEQGHKSMVAKYRRAALQVVK